MCLHDDIKQIAQIPHYRNLCLFHLKADGLNIWYIWMILKLFNCLIMFHWVQKLESITAVCILLV